MRPLSLLRLSLYMAVAQTAARSLEGSSYAFWIIQNFSVPGYIRNVFIINRTRSWNEAMIMDVRI